MTCNRCEAPAILRYQGPDRDELLCEAHGLEQWNIDYACPTCGALCDGENCECEDTCLTAHALTATAPYLPPNKVATS